MKHTNKELLGKGVKFLAIAVLFTLIGPSILFSAFNNQDHPLYIPVLIAGILASATAIFFMFRGILTMVKALFE